MSPDQHSQIVTSVKRREQLLHNLYTTFILTPDHPDKDRFINEIETLNSKLAINLQDPDPTQRGYTIPGEYGGVKRRVSDSFKETAYEEPNIEKGTFIVVCDTDYKFLGYAEVVIYTVEDPSDFVFTDMPGRARAAIKERHAEIREIAVDPKNPISAVRLLKEIETYCKKEGISHLFAYYISGNKSGGEPSPISNQASANFGRSAGFTPAIIADGDLENTIATGLYKNI